jgi:excisionase family DNA binding protein
MTVAIDRWLTRREVAEMVKLKPQSLARWAQDGRNIPFTKRGRFVRYRLSDVLAFLEGGMTGGDLISANDGQ